MLIPRKIEAFQPNRRSLLQASAALLGASALASLPGLAFAATEASWVVIENFNPAGKDIGSARVQKIVKTEAEWKKQLSANSFEITRHADTEPPFTGVYANNHADGLYRCICCETALFELADKVRVRHRLAEFLSADFEAECGADLGQHTRHEPHGNFLRPVRRASRPCV